MTDSTMFAQLAADATEAGIQQFVVGAVICSGEAVLLLRRPNDDFMGGIFELPSGKVAPGESLDSALLREVKEETGLDVTVIRQHLGTFDYTSGSGKASRQFNFVVDVAAVEPIVLEEHDDYQWARLDGELPVTEAVKVVLKAYVEHDAGDNHVDR
ncbi:NUDIX hydrolase [Amycolatopsis japonica]|uniref:NUDIX hydrolase n=1 Tax=Amycolatopsis japonica TaxID=208439 RepID=UPI0033E1CE72